MNKRRTMPDERGAPDWIRLDGKIEEYGLAEDPGRFLDGPLDPLPRIRGLSSVDAVQAWREIEEEIADIRNREPDQAILDACAEREAHLESIDEDPGRRELDHEPKAWFLNGEPWDEVDRASALEGLEARREVAADGGEDRGE